MKHILLYLATILFCFPFFVNGQPLSPKELRDNRGREFWVTFPINDHTTFNATRTDSLYFFVATERPTRVTIRFMKDNSIREFFIRNTNEMRIIGFPYEGYELAKAEKISSEVFEVTSDEEISVYAMNFADRTTDAFLAFPKDVLGREYFIFSYQSNITRPSNFAIVATENDTQIEINPTQPTSVFGLMPQRFTLQKGEAYMVQAQIRSNFDTTDLTGTRVSANKPIAVFAGHKRANIIYAPIRMDDVPRTQDYIIEQMLPTNVWRNTCFVVPLAQPGPTVTFRLPRPDTSRSDIVRILAAQDSTVISISERANATIQNTTIPTVTLNRGKYYEMLVGQPAVVRANKPIAAMIYRKSGSGGSFGDPFMAALPPVEQYLNRYKYLNVQGQQSRGFARFSEAFVEHYVSVIIPTIKVGTLRLNGNQLNGVEFSRIGETGYSYGLVRSEATVYDITADTTFGITVYGYGEANSYGYIGGMRFETDTIAPRIVTNPSCLELNGKIVDNLNEDSKIFWYEVPDTSKKNVTVRFENLPRPADSLGFSARLVNQFEDGEFALNTSDSLDLLTRRRFFIPGFTVHVNPNFRRNETIRLSTNAIALAAGLERCFELTLTNYGATTQTITTLDFAENNGVAQKEFYTTTPLPIILPPRTERRANVCFRSDGDGVFQDTVRIGNSCIRRSIAVLEVESGFDRIAPSVERSSDSCARFSSYRFADVHRYASGVAAVLPQNGELRNVTIATTRNSDGSITARATLVNPLRDGIVSFIVRDSIGNAREVHDTLQGNTLRLVFSPPSTSATQPNTPARMQFPVVDAGTVSCSTIQVWNDGILPLTLSTPLLQDNTIFSVPQSQFPLNISPASFREMQICFAPEFILVYSDTLVLRRGCTTDIVALLGNGGERILQGVSRCDVRVRLTPRINSGSLAQIPMMPHSGLSGSTPLRISHHPDPASDEFMLRLENLVPDTYTLTLHTLLGLEVLNIKIPVENASTGDFLINTSLLESGTYFYQCIGIMQSVRGHLRITR